MASLECRLPDGRRFRLADSVADRLSCGVVVLDPVAVGENPAVWAESDGLGQDLASALAGRKPSEIPGLAEARTLYKSFGMDPSRHRPSSEALLRRVLKGHHLYRINNLVDTCNLASLRFLLPIGMYDLSLVRGDVTLRAGVTGEHYPGIRKGVVNLAGRLGLFDDEGPFGSPTSDSARTCTGDATRAILAVIMATARYDSHRLAEQVDVFSQLFTRYCGAGEVFRTVLGGAS